MKTKINFKFLFYFIFFLLFSNFSNALTLKDFGLTNVKFSDLDEKKAFFISKQDDSTPYFLNPEEDFNLTDKIEKKFINMTFATENDDVMYQFAGSDPSKGVFIKSYLENGANIIESMNEEETFALDEKLKIINFARWSDNRLKEFSFIDKNKLSSFTVDPDQSGNYENEEVYTLVFGIPQIKSGMTIRDADNNAYGEFFDFNNYEYIFSLSKDRFGFEFTKERLLIIGNHQDLFIVYQTPDGIKKAIIYDEESKIFTEHGEIPNNFNIAETPGELRELLNKTFDNFLPTEYREIFNKAQMVRSKIVQFTYNDIKNFVNEHGNFTEEINSTFIAHVQKFDSIVQAKIDAIHQEEMRLQEIEDQKRIEAERKESERIALENEAKIKKEKLFKYGATSILILVCIAIIYFTNLFDSFIGIYKNFKKRIEKKMKNKDKKKGKKISRKNKSVGYWLADWVNNNFESGVAPMLIIFAIGATMFLILFLNYDWFESHEPIFWSWLAVIFFLMYVFFKVINGVEKYHCPKCKKIYAGEILSSTHIGSRQQARKFRTRERRTIRHDNYKIKPYSYTVEKDEMGTVQVDSYLNKVKCMLCNHNWEYNSSRSTRVG